MSILVVNFPAETWEALLSKATALGMAPAQFVAQLVALDVCEPERKADQVEACMEANR